MAMEMNETLLSLVTFRLFMLLLFCAWNTSEAMDLIAKCSNGGDELQEVTVCGCHTNEEIVCGEQNRVVIVDIIFGTFDQNMQNGACTTLDNQGSCGTAVVCEYKMSKHCADKDFLEILKACNGRHRCEIHLNGGRTMTCPGNDIEVTPHYATVKYRCETDDAHRLSVCGSLLTSKRPRTNAYLISPAFPDPDPTNQDRLCCCNITNIDALYLLHYDTLATTSPHIQFGDIKNGAFRTVDFQNKTVNVKIRTKMGATYYLTWEAINSANSGVFVAWLKGRTGVHRSTVTCGTKDCPQPSTTTTHQITPTSTSPSTPSSGESAGTKNNGGKQTGMIAGITVGALLLVITAVIVVVFLRRRRQSLKEPDNTPDEIYAQPSKKGDGSNAFTTSSDYELQQPPVPTKSPHITDAEGDYTYVETPDVVPQHTPAGNAIKKPLISKKPQRLAPVYDDADAKAYQTVDEEISANGVAPTAANKQNEPAYQEYGEVYQGSKPDGDSAPYQEYDASEAAEDYAYADRYRPTKIIQQVQNNPPALVSDYETGSSYTYAVVDKE